MSRRTIIVAICTLVIVGTSVYLFAAYEPGPATERLLIDWRSYLAISDARQGANRTIPMGIGVLPELWINHSLDYLGPPGYAPLSTREPPDNTGTATIYIQSTRGKFFYIGEFFDIWGQRVSKYCVLDYCSPQDGPPPWISDGNAEFCFDRDILWSRERTWIIFIGSTGAPFFDSTTCA